MSDLNGRPVSGSGKGDVHVQNWVFPALAAWSALDQLRPFPGRALNGSFCQKLPIAQREAVWQQRALFSAVQWICMLA
jgi:hypothetical protein